ncbi:MAG: SH3 domain-containing protein [Anaerolineaceae bacterium]|nr:SH3 domain-containing protein [Anaerolineaceae bacterium]
MTLPTSEPLPDEVNPLPPARRRRKRRIPTLDGDDERSTFLEELARRVTPSLDFFMFSLLSGVLLGLGLLFDAPALFVLAAILAPLMAPITGLSLATVVGSFSFFVQALGGTVIGSLIVFACGALTGWITRSLSLAGQQAALHVHFTWPDFLVLTLGAALTAYLLARAPRQKPVAASIAIAYELYLPIGIAGFGLTSGVSGLWPDGLLLFALHLVWAVLAGGVVLFALGLRPANWIGYAFSGAFLVSVVLIFVVANGLNTAFQQPVSMPPVRTETPTPTATGTVTPTSPAPTITSSPTNTLVPSRTPTLTVSPQPTPLWAKISAGESDGAFVRAQPDPTSVVVKSLLNGMLVEVLDDTVQNGSVTWIRVRTTEGLEGWIVQSLLSTATPVPTPAASNTLAPTVLPSSTLVTG